MRTATTVAQELKLVPSPFPSPIDVLIEKEKIERLIQAMCYITEQERDILFYLYFDEATYVDIGRVMGLTPGRIRQIHASLIRRIGRKHVLLELK